MLQLLCWDRAPEGQTVRLLMVGHGCRVDAARTCAPRRTQAVSRHRENVLPTSSNVPRQRLLSTSRWHATANVATPSASLHATAGGAPLAAHAIADAEDRLPRPARLLSPRRRVPARDWFGDVRLASRSGAARLLRHGCGSQVGPVVLTAGDRRIVRSPQPAAAD